MKRNDKSDAEIQYEAALQYVADQRRKRNRSWKEAIQAAGGEINVPVKYDDVPFYERRKVRELYVKQQGGLCWLCKEPLKSDPPKIIAEKDIRWDDFPDGFLDHPVHLHHDHETGLTEGAVHAYCNAILWHYSGK